MSGQGDPETTLPRTPGPDHPATERQLQYLWVAARKAGLDEAGLVREIRAVTDGQRIELTKRDASVLADRLTAMTGVEVVAPGQPPLLPGPPTGEEAAMIVFRERAESGEHFLALLEEAGGDEDRLIVMAETATTLGQLNTVADRAKKLGRYTGRFIVAERAARERLGRRAAAFTD